VRGLHKRRGGKPPAEEGEKAEGEGLVRGKRRYRQPQGVGVPRPIARQGDEKFKRGDGYLMSNQVYITIIQAIGKRIA